LWRRGAFLTSLEATCLSRKGRTGKLQNKKNLMAGHYFKFRAQIVLSRKLWPRLLACSVSIILSNGRVCCHTEY
jgi:hypothetical protein